MPQMIKLGRCEKLIKKETLHLVEIILAGIQSYNRSPLLRYAKIKSVSNKASSFILLRDVDNIIIGFLMFRIDKKFCYIYEIHVEHKYQSQGYGQMLLDDLYKQMVGKLLILFVHKNNIRARKFYEKNIFKIDETYVSKSYFMMIRFN